MTIKTCIFHTITLVQTNFEIYLFQENRGLPF